jgi:tetratricopeptide (TPR) repeat protein
MGLWPLAIEEFQKASALSHSSESLAELGHAYSSSGDRVDALKVVEQLRAESAETYVSPFEMAAVFAGLGDKNKTFSYLEQAYRERDSRMPFLAVDHWFDSLHSDPHFVELCHRVGLPTPTAEHTS